MLGAQIRAEDGRRVEACDISPFISNLPLGAPCSSRSSWVLNREVLAPTAHDADTPWGRHVTAWTGLPCATWWLELLVF